MFLMMSWFWRGFQSAVFYYLSCAPCSKLSSRRKRRKEYKKAKAEKTMNEMEEGVYEHLSPFSTNPYWREEIDVGPGPPVRKAQRDGRGKPETGKQKKDRQLRTGGPGSSTETGTSSADTMGGIESGAQSRTSRDGWNKRRYQREDEVLWGLHLQDTNSSEGGSPTARSASGSSYQYYARNPEINDLHPPVVSTQPRNKTETLWMLQPPPKAKVMEGKERASLENTPTRSRSTSGGSNWSRGTIKKPSDMSLGRQIGERLVVSKLKQGNLPSTAAESSTAMSRVSSARSNKSASSMTVAQGQPHDRDRDIPSAGETPTRTGSIKRPHPPPPPISISVSSADTTLPSHPPLSPIPSETPSKSPRPALQTAKSATSVSSLRALQELVTPAAQLNTLVISKPQGVDGADDEVEARGLKLPDAGKGEARDLDTQGGEDRSPVSPVCRWDFAAKGVKENRTAPLPATGSHRWSMSI